MNLNCKFCYDRAGHVNRPDYICLIDSSSKTEILEPNVMIRKINGDHLDGKSDKDVEVIWFKHAKVNYFPHGLNEIFPNLKIVRIQECGLKSLTRKDLVGLENTESLWCDANNITSLPNDMFHNMSKLIYIAFQFNDLQFISSELLTPIFENDLQVVDFSGNHSIDAFYIADSCNYRQLFCENEADSVAELMAMIDEQCDKPINDEQTISKTKLKVLKTEEFKELWTTGCFSDITIVTDTKKFKAHKVVLAVQTFEAIQSIIDEPVKEELINQPKVLKKLVKAKRNFDSMVNKYKKH
ncbi:CLUMA_CG009227, isoform A [Clunio marinus]|uniref:CLUMA_CG009227, isoform A n=1 Tax=Clunio marinus TaxID=568069 RepID=A0A1J1I7Q7_9DIPT|nr:CLUMA_CG009227, isoform A [Clunio marinus]